MKIEKCSRAFETNVGRLRLYIIQSHASGKQIVWVAVPWGKWVVLCFRLFLGRHLCQTGTNYIELEYNIIFSPLKRLKESRVL